MTAARRFAGTARLLGEPAWHHVRSAHVIVVGLGGVGSWAAEALARSGIGRLTLIDMDHVAESNVNRQIQALTPTLGMAKVIAMRERLAQITDSPIDVIDDFVTVDNAAELLSAEADCIIDAIDQAAVKAAMIVLARRRRQAIVVCGAAGARTDPLQLVCTDLAITAGDALLASVRSRLRRDHGYSRNPKRRFGVPALHSRQQAFVPGATVEQAAGGALAEAELGVSGAPLACAGYGSMAAVTGAMGFAAAATALARIDRAGKRRESQAGLSMDSVTDSADGPVQIKAQFNQRMQDRPANQGARTARSSVGET